MALRLGKTVKQLLSELDSNEITEWLAYVKIENEGHVAAKRSVPGKSRPVATQGKPADVKATMKAMFGDRIRVVKKRSRK